MFFLSLCCDNIFTLLHHIITVQKVLSRPSFLLISQEKLEIPAAIYCNMEIKQRMQLFFTVNLSLKLNIRYEHLYSLTQSELSSANFTVISLSSL